MALAIPALMRFAFALALALGLGACKQQGQGQAADTMTRLPGSAGMNPEDDSRAHKSPRMITLLGRRRWQSLRF